jgi:hypothetical protein
LAGRAAPPECVRPVVSLETMMARAPNGVLPWRAHAHWPKIRIGWSDVGKLQVRKRHAMCEAFANRPAVSLCLREESRALRSPNPAMNIRHTSLGIARLPAGRQSQCFARDCHVVRRASLLAMTETEWGIARLPAGRLRPRPVARERRVSQWLPLCHREEGRFEESTRRSRYHAREDSP